MESDGCREDFLLRLPLQHVDLSLHLSLGNGNVTVNYDVLRLTHTERQASLQVSVSSDASDLCNGSGTHLEHQVKHQTCIGDAAAAA